jgi:ABC-type bacteriocin/lantibiotic exporter with double-glycine peptidase domain
MVFGAYGRDVSEFDLRLACRTGDDGTSPEAAAAAAVAYGFADSFTDYLTVDQLIDELSRGLFPIVFIELSEGVVCPHAVVVLEVAGAGGIGGVRYLDPELGEQERPLAEFARMWSRANGRAIVVEPGPGLDDPAGPESDAGAPL